jgi:predicted ATPase
LEQQQLFEHFFELLLRLSLRRPLLLMLDDLQWADGATINLLFHLSRRLPESRILVVGSYRTSEVAVGRFEAGAGIDRQHPLKPVVQELKRRFGTIEIDLSRFVPQAGQAFVEAMLDSEPNGLDAEFRQALFWRTKGHPLFTVELLRALQDQGDLFLDDEGRWQATPTLSWDALPARVEAVIAQRVGRLDDATRELLTIASVEGEQFTAQVVGEVMDISERSLLRTLSQELERRHRLVFERDEIEVGHHYLTQYQFRHALFQQYLYNSLSPGEKRVHHGEVARALENVYETARESVTIQLAHHYRQAGERQKALDYSRQAANRAETMYAFEEAIEYVSSALTMIRPGEQRELRMALLEQVADLHVSMGERRQAVAIYQEAVGHHQSMAHAADTTLVRLHRKIGSTIVHMKWYEERQEHVALARRHLSEGLALTEEMPANREGARLLIALAEERWYSRVNPDWASAERYAAKAMDMARELEAPVELSAAMNSMAAVYGARGMLRERVKISMERLELSRDPRFNDERERANILTQVGRALTLIGDYDAAMGHLRLAQEMSRRIQALDTLYYSLRYQAYCHYRLDNWDAVLEIEQQLRQSTERYTNFEERTGPNCFFIALVAAVRGLRGEHGEAERWREESVAAMLANDGPAEGWGRDNLY